MLIVAVSLVIEPSAMVMSPNFELVAAVIVPDVLTLLEPILIVAVSLVIEPSAIVMSPNFELVAAIIVPDVVKELSENDIAFVEDVIALPLILIFPISAVPFTSIFPDEFMFPTVTSPEEIVPDVKILFVPMLIVAVSLVIEPSAIVTSPNLEPEAPSTVEVKIPF